MAHLNSASPANPRGGRALQTTLNPKVARSLKPWTDAPGRTSPVLWQAGCVALVLAVAIFQALIRTDVDLAWLLTVGEKMAAGQRLYVDIWEVNPPFSVFLYLPAVYSGRFSGLAPEVFIMPLVVLAGCLSAALSTCIAAPLIERDPARVWRFSFMALFTLLAFPTATFNQREHIAVVALLPFVVLAAARAQGERPPLWLAVLAGMGAGVSMCIKPYFALCAGLPLLANAVRARSLRPAVEAESWTAAAVVLGYLATVAVAFRAFFTNLMPTLALTYLPVRASLVVLMLGPGMAVLAVLACVAVAQWSKLRPRSAVLVPFAAACLGGVASYFVQGKVWPYQAYPMLAFALFGLIAAPDLGASVWALPPQRRRGILLRTAPALTVIAAALAMGWFGHRGSIPSGLRERVAYVAPRPSLLTLTGDIALGHPLVRELHGKWVGKVCSEWATLGVIKRMREGASPALKARLSRFAQADRDRLTTDIETAQPRVILIDRRGFDWNAWARADRRLAAALSPYRFDSSFGGVEVWLRTAPASGGSDPSRRS
jgi:hypothetical protein